MEHPSESAGPGDGRDAWALVLLLILALAALWPVLNVPADMAPGLPDHDARTQWYPWRAYGFGELRQGEVPLWNPYILCGTPFLGSFQSALFYPPNLLFAAMPIAKAAKASIVLHLWLAMIFTYLLARMFCRGRVAAFIGAVAFGMCAAVILRVPAGHWGVSCAIAWLPLVIICIEKIMRKLALGPVMLGAFAVAMQVYSGIPQIVFITAIAAAVYGLARGFGEGLDWPGRWKRWGCIAAAFVLGAGLSGPQLVPGFEAALNGARSLPMRREWVEQFSLGAENVATMLLPGFFGGLKNGFYWGRFFYWEMNMYGGIAALALAITGLAATRPQRRAIWFGVLAAAMLLLALGKHTPLMQALTALPFGEMLRGPAKFILPFSLAMSVLAAMGADVALRPGRGRDLLIVAGILAVAALGLAIGARTWLPDWQKALYWGRESLYAFGAEGTNAELAPIIVSAIQSLAMLAALAAALLLFRRHEKVLPVMVAAVVVADGILFSWGFLGPWATFNATGTAWPEGAAEAARSAGPNARTLAFGMPEMNDAMIERMHVIEGIEPNPPARFHMLFRRGQGEPVDIAPSMYQAYEPSPEFMRMGLGRLLLPAGAIERNELIKTLWSSGSLELLGLPSAVPRARVVYESVAASSGEDAYVKMMGGSPYSRVVLEQKSEPPQSGVAAAATSAEIKQDSPDRVAIHVELERPGWLVLLDNYYPGWVAEVDGAPASIYRADYSFRAVALPAGAHDVVFEYRPASLKIGCAAAVVTVLGCLAVAIFARAKKPGKGK